MRLETMAGSIALLYIYMGSRAQIANTHIQRYMWDKKHEDEYDIHIDIYVSDIRK